MKNFFYISMNLLFLSLNGSMQGSHIPYHHYLYASCTLLVRNVTSNGIDVCVIGNDQESKQISMKRGTEVVDLGSVWDITRLVISTRNNFHKYSCGISGPVTMEITSTLNQMRTNIKRSINNNVSQKYFKVVLSIAGVSEWKLSYEFQKGDEASAVIDDLLFIPLN